MCSSDLDDFNTEMNKSIRVIKEYDLHELSLVDNPANQFATILSVEKMDGKDQGYLSKTEINNVFWCGTDDLVNISENADSSCPSCSKVMQNIGFIEKSDSENADMIKFLVDSAKGISTSKMTKEEDPMTEETTPVEEPVTKSEEIVEPADGQTETEDSVHSSEEDTMAEITPETETEKSMNVDDSVAERNDAVGEADANPSDATATPEIVTVTKSDSAVADAVAEIKDSLTNAFGDLAATIKSLNEETINSLNAQVAELRKSIALISGEVKEDRKSTRLNSSH